MDSKTLAPWDRLPYYAVPTETAFSLSALQPTPIAPGDPMRVLIMFALTAPQSASLSINWPIPVAFSQSINVQIPVVNVSTLPVGAGVSGLFLPPTGEPLTLTARKHGPLVTAPWYATIGTPSTVTLTVFIVRMTSWPDDSAQQNLIQQVDNGSFRPVVDGYKNGIRRAKLYGNSWRERQASAFDDLPYLYDPDLH